MYQGDLIYVVVLMLPMIIATPGHINISRLRYLS